jgi:hypothetical protein
VKGEDMLCCGNVENWGVAPIFIFVFAGLMIFIGLIVTIAITWLYCRIFSKAGYCWALGLLMLIPIVRVIMLCVLGIGDWPVLKELRQLREKVNQNKPQGS